jgi:cell fate regulator YaaT (PSP1 superfamily)
MIHEYLVTYGLHGDFGRFRPLRALTCRRGDRVVIRTPRGTEIGEVLREATPRHATFLPNTSVGELLRTVTNEDETTLGAQRDRGQQVFDESRRLALELDLPLELLDLELLFDAEHVVLHLVRWAECDVRPWVSRISTHFALRVLLEDLTRPDVHAHEHGCGSCGSGGCGSCGEGGCGTCGSASPDEVQAYFAELREKMESARVPLL